MARAEEMAEQAVAVEVAGEDADAPAAERPALVPIGARRRVEPGAQALVVDADVGASVGAAEEAEECLVVGQVLQRADLQLAERDMSAVEVDRGDASGIGGQVGEHVAAARSDGDDLVPRTDLERLHVDDRVFPDLRIDELREREGEHALEHAGPRQGPCAMHGSPEVGVGRLANRLRGVPQLLPPSLQSDRSALDESRDGGVTGEAERRSSRNGIAADSPSSAQKKSGSAGRGPADPLAIARCLRSVLALGGWGARKPSKPRTDPTRHCNR